VRTEPWGRQGGGFVRCDFERERALLVDAFTKVAAEQGYARATVPVVAATAGLPSSAFYEQFGDKRQCLLAAYDHFFARLVEEIEEATDFHSPWAEQVETGVAAALAFVLEQVDAARLFAVEALTVGPTAVDRYQASTQRVAALLRQGREHSPEAAALPRLTEAMLAAGAVSLVTSALLAEDPARLQLLEPQLVEVLLLPYAPAGDTPRVLA
jgi:AcrR family transcriptional regulator